MKTNLKIGLLASAALAVLLLSRCSTKPKNARPVKNFDVKRYLGTWYELARFDYRFERHQINTTARYTLREDGSIGVFNRGYDTLKKEWKSVEGKAKFRGDKTVGALKVSFFGPFYSGYNVIALDPEYQYALVAGKSLDYLWILSRTTTIPQPVKANFLQLADAVGYDRSRLIWVEHRDVK